MKSDRFLRALGELDDELIAEYEKSKKQKRRTAILRYTALAASLCLIITATVTAVPFLNQTTATPGTESTGQSITASEYTPTDPPKAEGDFKIISVAAAKTDGTYISTDTDFIVTAENGSADLVREHLFISGGPEYTVSEGEEENTYNVTLDKSLASGKVVSLSFVNDGVADYSWAFQTESKLQVEGNYPADGATGVAEESVIELEFSHALQSDISEFVTVSPALEGSWERIGKIHRFTPATPLAADTDYTVTVAAGITSGEATLESKYTFTFSTSQKKSHQCYPDPITFDGVNTYRTGESIIIRYEDHADELSTVGKVALYDFGNAENMIDYAGGRDEEEPTLIGDEAFSTEIFNTEFFYSVNLTLDRTLSAGYYLARVYEEDGSCLFEWIIQVHPLTVYAAVTERDVLVWVADANGLAEGIPVKYLEHTATTDVSGIALLEDVTDGSEDTGYLYIGEEETPLTVALENYAHNNYPAGYIYTDRPRYKTDDEIQAWGCIPMDLFYDEPDGVFTLSLEDEQKVNVTPDENGTFTASFTLKDHTPDDWTQLKLSYNGNVIATRTVNIEDYELQNYSFELMCESNYVYAGNSFELGVRVFHVSGVTVSGKKVRVHFAGSNYHATTGEDGIARFSLPTSEWSGDFDYNYGKSGSISTYYVSVYNGDIEESAAMSAVADTTLYIINHSFIARRSASEGILTLAHNRITTDGITTLTQNYADSMESYNVIGESVDTTGSITGTVRCDTRPITGYEYDPYTKTNNPVYGEAVSTEISVKTVQFSTENGVAKIDLSQFDVPANTETEWYHLNYKVSINTGDKVQYYGGSYYPNGSYYNHTTTYSKNFINQGFGYGDYSYDLYNYCFTVNGIAPSTFAKTYFYKEGERIDLRLKDLSGEFTPAGGTVLRLIYGEDIKDASLFTDSGELDFTCDGKVFPHAKVTGAYYLNGVFYRMPYTYLQVDESERKAEIHITTDKDSYAPGGEVTLTVSTTDKDGAPLPCAVNISVVNEAAFACQQENNNILSAMLTKQHQSVYPSYAYTSYRDYAMHYCPGGWGDGGGDEVRSDFGDTAAFKTVKTDGSGKATVTFTLPDSVTEYRITVHAASGEMYYGVNTSSITANMDFFLQFTEPKAVKDTDDLVLNANTVSGVNGTVDFEFTVKETGTTLTASAPTGANASANFGKLPAGSYTALIKASCGEYTDAVEFPFDIVREAVAATVSEEVDISSTLTLTPASSPVTLDIYTESTRKYLELFGFLQNNISPRLDTILAGSLGMNLKNKLLGKEDLVPRIDIDSDYYGDNALKMLPAAEEDIVLTALHVYFSGSERYYKITSSPIGKSLSADELTERLMCTAASGDAVLTDLHSAESYVTDDAYHQTLLSISYAMLGDYEGAKRLYDGVTDDSEEEGYGALRAIAATFVDRGSAGSMIDELIDSDPAAPYLSYAVYAYLASCADVIKEEQTLTVSYGDVTKSVSVSGLETKGLTLTGEGTLTVDFETESESVCATVTYESSDPPATDGAFTAYIEGEVKKSSTVDLVIDLSALPCDSGQMDIVLPACLRYCGSAYPAKGVGVSAKYERLAVYKSSSDSSVIRIPLVVINEGEYVFENVIFTYGGKMYRSDAFTVNATK